MKNHSLLRQAKEGLARGHAPSLKSPSMIRPRRHRWRHRRLLYRLSPNPAWRERCGVAGAQKTHQRHYLACGGVSGPIADLDQHDQAGALYQRVVPGS